MHTKESLLEAAEEFERRTAAELKRVRAFIAARRNDDESALSGFSLDEWARFAGVSFRQIAALQNRNMKVNQKALRDFRDGKPSQIKTIYKIAAFFGVTRASFTRPTNHNNHLK